MKFPRCARIIMLGIVFCVIPAITQADEIVFHKVLDSGDIIDVVGNPGIPAIITPERRAEDAEWLKKMPPGSEILHPAFTKKFDFLLRGKRAKDPVILYSLLVNGDSATSVEDELHIFDAIEFKDKVYFALIYYSFLGTCKFDMTGKDSALNFFTASADGVREDFRESPGKMTVDAAFYLEPDGNISVDLYKDNGNISAWKLQGTKWSSVKLPIEQLVTKDLLVDGKQWRLSLTREYTSANILTKESPKVVDGRRFLLSKTPLPPGGTVQPVIIWNLFKFNDSFTPKFQEKWSADVVFDGATQQIYLALSDRRRIWIQVFDFNAKPFEGVISFPIAVEPTFLQNLSLMNRLILPDDAMNGHIPSIDNLSLTKKGESLQLTVSDTAKKISQTWSISVADRESPSFHPAWTKIAETGPR